MRPVIALLTCLSLAFGGRAETKDPWASTRAPHQGLQGASADCLPLAPPRTLANEMSIRGSPAEKGGFPFIVSLQANGRHFCGGTILTNTIILTAAHCLFPSKYNQDEEFYEPHISMLLTNMKIVAGEHFLDTEEGTEQRREVLVVDMKYIVHEDYEHKPLMFLPNDIALLRLKEPLVFNEYVKAVQLPDRGTKSPANVVLAGWGLTNEILHTPTNVLLALPLPVKPHHECFRTMQRWLNLMVGDGFRGEQLVNDESFPDSILCTGPLTGGRGPCFGDSGGPLVTAGGVLMGVTSTKSVICGLPDYPSFFTRVAAHLDWIERTARHLSLAPCPRHEEL